MAKSGFSGFGSMVPPMAWHFLEAGHEVALWSHTTANARRLAGAVHVGVIPSPPHLVRSG